MSGGFNWVESPSQSSVHCHMDTPDPILNTRCGSPRQLADSPAHSVDMSETAVQPCPSVIAEGSLVEVGDGTDHDLLPFEVLMCWSINRLLWFVYLLT